MQASLAHNPVHRNTLPTFSPSIRKIVTENLDSSFFHRTANFIVKNVRHAVFEDDGDGIHNFYAVNESCSAQVEVLRDVHSAEFLDGEEDEEVLYGVLYAAKPQRNKNVSRYAQIVRRPERTKERKRTSKTSATLSPNLTPTSSFNHLAILLISLSAAR